MLGGLNKRLELLCVHGDASVPRVWNSRFCRHVPSSLRDELRMLRWPARKITSIITLHHGIRALRGRFAKMTVVLEMVWLVNFWAASLFV